MTMRSRDKTIIMVLVPLLLVGAFVFLVLKPKREEAVQAAKALESQRDRRDQAVGLEQQLIAAKQTFTADYTAVVRLGKAVPTSVDMPSVLVQLERAARGTGIDFGKITVGERVASVGGATSAGGSGSAAPAGGAEGSSSSAQPVAAGGAKAQSGAGQTTEKANDAAAGANQSAAASENASAEGSKQTSTPAGGKGGLPVGGGAAPAAGGSAAGAAAAPPGLDTVPLELHFTGSFFELADLFHELKRFVNVANQRLMVRGRLMTIDSFSFGSESFPKIEADMNARIFLAPQQQGATAGASPSGPSPGGAAGSTSTTSAPSPTATSAAAPGVATP